MSENINNKPKSKFNHFVDFIMNGLNRLGAETAAGVILAGSIVFGIVSGLFNSWTPIAIWGIVLGFAILLFLMLAFYGLFLEIRDKWSEYKRKHDVQD